MVALTEQRLSAARGLAEEIELLFRIGALAHSTGARVARFWLAAKELRRESDRILAETRTMASEAKGIEIDPTDHGADQYLAMQLRIHRLIDGARDWANRPFLPFFLRWLLRWTERELRALHRNWGLARTIILEHDADCSPVLDGEFESADELVAALKKDAA